MTNATQRGIRSAQLGMLINAVLAIAKLVAGLVGNTYALIADAVESTLDIFSSFIVWAGLAIASRPADADHPYGHGKAESVAAVGVSFMLIGAAIGIALQAVREILTPHKTPAPWTLGVLVGVVVIKWVLSRRVHTVGTEIGSTAVRADAWHHMSDAMTSAAAFIGISIALIGSRLSGASGWASADDWAALFASAVIGFNGIVMLQPALHDLMDRMPGEDIVGPVQRAVRSAHGVLATEKLGVRKAGMTYLVTIHVQADPSPSLHDAHILAGKDKSAIRAAVPEVESVLVHMEPFEEFQVTVDASATHRERD